MAGTIANLGVNGPTDTKTVSVKKQKIWFLAPDNKLYSSEAEYIKQVRKGE